MSATGRSREETEEDDCRDFLEASSRLLQQNSTENISAKKWKPLQEAGQTNPHVFTTQTLLPVSSITQSSSSSSVDRKGLIPSYHSPPSDFSKIIPSVEKSEDETQLIQSLRLDFIHRSQQASPKQFIKTNDLTSTNKIALSSTATVSSPLSVVNCTDSATCKGKRGRKRKPEDNIVDPAKHKRPQLPNKSPQQLTKSPQQPIKSPQQPTKSPQQPNKSPQPPNKSPQQILGNPFKTLPETITTSSATNLDILKQAALANFPDTYHPLSMTESSSKKKKSKKTEGKPTTAETSTVIVQGKPPFAVMSAPLHNRILVQNSGQHQTLTLGQQRLIIPSTSYTTNLLQQSSVPIMFAPPKPHHIVSGANKSLVVQHPTVPSHQQFVKLFPEQLATTPFYRPNAPMIVISAPSVVGAQPISTKASPTFPPPK